MFKRKDKTEEITTGSIAYSVSRRKKFWLSIILSFLCAALLCCAFLLPSNGTASAAVKPDAVIKWEGIKNYQYYESNIANSVNDNMGKVVALNDFATASTGNISNSYGVSSFDATTATARGSNVVNTQRTYVLAYVQFKAIVTIPAFTEYKIKFSETMYINAKIDGTGGLWRGWADFYAFGETDQSSGLQFGYLSSTSGDRAGYVTPSGVKNIHNSAVSKTSGSNTTFPVAEAYSDTFTNNTNQEIKKTVYFGFFTAILPSRAFVYNYESTAKMTTDITVSKINEPTVDKQTAVYDANGNTFTFTNYDKDRMDFTVKYTDAANTETDVTSSTTINSDGTCKLTDVGKYLFTFKIKDNCGAIWNSTTNDQSDKTLTITITKKEVTPPTISETTATYDKIGNKFAVTGYDSSTVTASCATDGISWNGTLFEAENAGEYTVKFALTDKDNYQWSGGGTDDKEIKLTVTAKSVQVKWTTEKTEITDGGNSFFVMLPVLDVTAEVKGLLTEVKYYLKDDCTINGANITVSGNAVENLEKGKNYYAVVQVDTELAKSNYTFSGNFYSAFDTKDDRTVVVITVENLEETYDGEPKAATAKVVTADGVDVTDIALKYEYFADGSDTGSEVAPTDAGTYKLVISILSPSNETYTAAGSLEFEFVIAQADPELDPFCKKEGLFAGDGLSSLSAGSSSTAGSYAWDNPEQKLQSGTYSYSYTFTPDNKNYKTVKGTVSLSAAVAGVKSITAEFNFPEKDDNGNDFFVYDSWKPDSLKQYLTVTGTKEDGSVQEDLQGYVITTQTLTEGTNVPITISYGNVTCIVTIPEVKKCVLVSITAFCTPTKPVYTSTNINTLKQYLTVTGKNNDGSDYSGTINGADCTLSFGDDNKLTAGTINITVTYNGLTATCSVTVTEVALGSITASWLPKLEVDEITGKTDVDTLKTLIKVTGKNNDGSDYNDGEEITDYSIEKTVEGTTLTVYISYNGFHAELTKEVEAEPSVTEKIKVPLPDFSVSPAYTGKEINILDGWKHANLVTATGNTGTDADTYSATITLKDPDKYEWEGNDGDGITVTWQITPAVINGSWNDRNGTLNLTSESYTEDLSGLIKYTYYDAEGNEVVDKNLVEGQTYKVVAELVDATGNFALSEQMSTLISVPHEFEVKISENSFVDNAVKFLKNYWPIVLGVLLGLLLLIILIIVLVARRRRADDEDYDEYFDEDDEDDEDEDYDEDDYDDYGDEY